MVSLILHGTLLCVCVCVCVCVLLSSQATPVGENQQPPQSQEVPDAATDTATQTDISPAHVDASASGDVAAQSSAQADSTQAQAQHAAAQQEAAQVVAATRAEEASSLRQKLEDTLSQVSTLEAQLSQVRCWPVYKLH